VSGRECLLVDIRCDNSFN